MRPSFLRLAAREAGASELRFRDRTCDPFEEPERVSVAEAFAAHAGVDLMASIRADGSTDAVRMGEELDRIGVRRAGGEWLRRCSRRGGVYLG